MKSGAILEGLANICVTAAEKALEVPPKGYTPTQRNGGGSALAFAFET